MPALFIGPDENSAKTPERERERGRGLAGNWILTSCQSQPERGGGGETDRQTDTQRQRDSDSDREEKQRERRGGGTERERGEKHSGGRSWIIGHKLHVAVCTICKQVIIQQKLRAESVVSAQHKPGLVVHEALQTAWEWPVAFCQPPKSARFRSSWNPTMCAVTSSHSREIDPDMPRALQPNSFLSFTAKDWETLGQDLDCQN